MSPLYQVAHQIDAAALLWAVVATLLAVVLIPVGIWVLPEYVRTKGNFYSESFFATLKAVDTATAPPEPGSEDLHGFDGIHR